MMHEHSVELNVWTVDGCKHFPAAGGFGGWLHKVYESLARTPYIATLSLLLY